MSALCACVLALHQPAAVSRLVLAGVPPGSGWSLVRYRAMPFHWPPWHPDLWRMLTWGVLLAVGRGSLATHKRLDALLERANLVDESLASAPPVEPGDEDLPPPPRDRWWLAIRSVRLMPLVHELHCPVLVIVGRHDPRPRCVSAGRSIVARRRRDSSCSRTAATPRSWRNRTASCGWSTRSSGEPVPWAPRCCSHPSSPVGGVGTTRVTCGVGVDRRDVTCHGRVRAATGRDRAAPARAGRGPLRRGRPPAR